MRNDNGSETSLCAILEPKDTDEGNITSFFKLDNDYYGITDKNLRKQRLQEIHSLVTPVVERFPGTFGQISGAFEQISMCEDSADAFLVLTDLNSSSKLQRYVKYQDSANAIIAFDVFGDFGYATIYDPNNPNLMVRSKDNQFFDKALNLIGSNNTIRLVKKYHNKFMCSIDEGPLQEWYFDDTYYMDHIVKGFHRNGKFYLIVDDYTDGSRQKLWSFRGYSDKNRYFVELKSNENSNFGKFLKIGYNKYLLESDYCAYYVKDSQFMPNTYPGNGV